MSTIGSRIQDKREELGLTQDDLAKQIHVSRSLIQAIESDTRELSKVYMLMDLSKALSLSPTYILTGYDEEHFTVGQELGLSNLTITMLQMFQVEGNIRAASVFDTLIQNPLLIMALYAYFHGDFKNLYAKSSDHKVIKLSAEQFAFAGQDAFASMNLEDFEIIARLSIMEELKNIRKEMRKDGKS